jgi:phosphate acetyltransferase
MFLETMRTKMHGKGMRIVFPDGDDERTVKAAVSLIADEALKPVLIVSDQGKLKRLAEEHRLNLEGIATIIPGTDERLQSYTSIYYELRKHKGISREEAKQKALRPNYFGALMVRDGQADGMVSGLTSETKPFIPAFEVVKLREGFRRASSVFVLEWPERLLFFADCSVNINPDAQTLSDIVHATAQTVRWFGHEPRIALLSYSTRDSAKGEAVDKVKQATALAKRDYPDVIIDGEIQFDAALLPEVAQRKAPDSPFCEKGANVFIFPDLDSGNIAYKITERLGRARATGPILQGLNHPINDLSRGCAAEDIANVGVLTAAQAFIQKQTVTMATPSRP